MPPPTWVPAAPTYGNTYCGAGTNMRKRTLGLVNAQRSLNESWDRTRDKVYGVNLGGCERVKLSEALPSKIARQPLLPHLTEPAELACARRGMRKRTHDVSCYLARNLSDYCGQHSRRLELSSARPPSFSLSPSSSPYLTRRCTALIPIPSRPRFSPSTTFLTLFCIPLYIIILSYPPSVRGGSGDVLFPGAAAARVRYGEALCVPQRPLLGDGRSGASHAVGFAAAPRHVRLLHAMSDVLDVPPSPPALTRGWVVDYLPDASPSRALPFPHPITPSYLLISAALFQAYPDVLDEWVG
ncbi:hypothetical protein C8J57DRAFT_1732373 [Mycena rebaudengoi]|nr:hypothetical protein C8J57DRAFT_1732373 [Mycena rebaudengoi]